MTSTRVAAAAGSVVVAAAVNVATGMLTQNWTAAWGACTGVLVLLAVALAVWQTRLDGASVQRSQRVLDVESGGSLTMRMSGPGKQVLRGAKVDGDVTQSQED